MKINPHDPAYPVTVTVNTPPSMLPVPPATYTGIPIRLELAARMAQGLCATATAYYDRGPCNDAIVERAFVLADALIAAYNEGQE